MALALGLLGRRPAADALATSPRSRLGPLAAALVASPFALTAACGDGDSGADADTDVSFAADIRPIFQTKCYDCHWDGNAVEVDLTDPFNPDTGIIERPNSFEDSEYTLLVDPGNVGNSSIIKKVSDPDLPSSEDGHPMPWPVERVTEEELADIEQWIEDGANDDAFFAENVAPIFGTEVTLRAPSGKCTYCHAPGSPHDLDVTNPFDPEVGMVDVDSDFGGKIVEPGDPDNSMLVEKLASDTPPGSPMPLHYPRLTDEEISLLEGWIAAGAPDN